MDRSLTVSINPSCSRLVIEYFKSLSALKISLVPGPNKIFCHLCIFIIPAFSLSLFCSLLLSLALSRSFSLSLLLFHLSYLIKRLKKIVTSVLISSFHFLSFEARNSDFLFNGLRWIDRWWSNFWRCPTLLSLESFWVEIVTLGRVVSGTTLTNFRLELSYNHNINLVWMK